MREAHVVGIAIRSVPPRPGSDRASAATRVLERQRLGVLAAFLPVREGALDGVAEQRDDDRVGRQRRRSLRRERVVQVVRASPRPRPGRSRVAVARDGARDIRREVRPVPARTAVVVRAREEVRALDVLGAGKFGSTPGCSSRYFHSDVVPPRFAPTTSRSGTGRCRRGRDPPLAQRPLGGVAAALDRGRAPAVGARSCRQQHRVPLRSPGAPRARSRPPAAIPTSASCGSNP